jgi:hypothetical protein
MLKNLRSAIKNTLIAAGLAKRLKDGVLIQRPLIFDNIIGLLGEDNRIYARAMLLEV